MARLRVFLVIALACCLLGPARGSVANKPGPGGIMAGAAVVEITPDLSGKGVHMAGYSNRLGRPAKGVHDPLSCRALVIDDGLQNAAIIGCDLVSISAALREKVIERLHGTPFNDQNILISATHTHSGPGGYEKNPVFPLVLFGSYNDKFTSRLAERIAGAVKNAHQSRKPVVMRVAETELAGMVRNRRYPGGYDYLTRRSRGEGGGLTCPTLTLFRFDDLDGRPMAVLFHFPAHATILGPDNMLISAEWPGVARDVIEQNLPGAVAIFLNGPEGDQTPDVKKDDASDMEWVERFGRGVAEAALEIIDCAEPIKAAPVRSAITRRPVPGWGRLMGIPLPPHLVKRLFPELTLQVVRIGEAAFLAIPLEMTAAPGAALKDSARGEAVDYPLVVGLANDFYWYCVGSDESEGSPYEVGNTIFGDREAGIVIGEELLLLEAVNRE